MCVCVRVCVCVCVCVRERVCVYICIHTYIYSYSALDSCPVSPRPRRSRIDSSRRSETGVSSPINVTNSRDNRAIIDDYLYYFDDNL